MRNVKDFIDSKPIALLYMIIKSSYENWNKTGKKEVKTFRH